LTALVIISVVVVGVIAAVSWFSNPITLTLSVSFNINAKTNVNPVDGWVGMEKVAYADLVETAVFFDGSQVDLPEGPKYIFVRLGTTNVDAFYTKVTATRPAGMFVTCDVCIVDRRDQGEYPESTDYWHELGSIALDGSQSIELVANGLPTYMISEPVDHMRYAMYRFNVGPGSLPPGSHQLSVVIEICDTP